MGPAGILCEVGKGLSVFCISFSGLVVHSFIALGMPCLHSDIQFRGTCISGISQQQPIGASIYCVGQLLHEDSMTAVQHDWVVCTAGKNKASNAEVPQDAVLHAGIYEPVPILLDTLVILAARLLGAEQGNPYVHLPWAIDPPCNVHEHTRFVLKM